MLLRRELCAGIALVSLGAPAQAQAPNVDAQFRSVSLIDRRQKDSPTLLGFLMPKDGLSSADASKVDETLRKNLASRKPPTDDSTKVKLKLHLSAIANDLEEKLKEQHADFDVKDLQGSNSDLIVTAPVRRIYVLAGLKEVLCISLAD